MCCSACTQTCLINNKLSLSFLATTIPFICVFPGCGNSVSSNTTFIRLILQYLITSPTVFAVAPAGYAAHAEQLKDALARI